MEEEKEEKEKQEILVMNKNMFITGENNRWCCWLDLPNEILELIMKRLYYADLLNFRVVCKSWNSSINRSGGVTAAPPLKQSPWLLMFDRIKFTLPPLGASTTYYEMLRSWKKTSKACSCKLFDPVYKKTYTINNMISNNISINLFLIQHVYASKHGWILVSSPGHDFGIAYCSLFFAYTPFSTVNNFIELPPLKSCHIQLATFTSNPSIMDQDCLFVVLHNPFSNNTDNNYVHQGIRISTCRPGDKSWSSRYLKYRMPVSEFYSYPVSFGTERWIYSEGNIYYTIHLRKKLGQTRVVKWEWELVRNVKWVLVIKNRSGHGGNHEEEEEEHSVLYGSVMNKKLDEVDDDDDDLLSKLEKDHFSFVNYFAQPLSTAGTEYGSCHTGRYRKMVKIDPPHY